MVRCIFNHIMFFSLYHEKHSTVLSKPTIIRSVRCWCHYKPETAARRWHVSEQDLYILIQICLMTILTYPVSPAFRAFRGLQRTIYARLCRFTRASRRHKLPAFQINVKPRFYTYCGSYSLI